jgi:hypothetical protein
MSHTTSFLVRSTQFRFSGVTHVSCGGAETIGKASSLPGGPRATLFFAPALDIRQSLRYAARLLRCHTTRKLFSGEGVLEARTPAGSTASQSAIDDFICHALGQTRPLRYSLSFCGQAPALGAKPLVEGWRVFGRGRPRSHRRRPRGPSLGFARRWHLGGTRDRCFLLRKHNDWRPLRFMPHRLDHFPWCFGGPLWDFRRRNQTGFRGVRQRLFTISRGVHGIEPIENANFQVINRDTSREAKTRGQGQRNERHPSTGPQLVLSIRDAGFLSGIATYSEGDTTRLPRG